MQSLTSWLVRVAAVTAMFAPPLSAQSSRDSAGILIVENTRPAWNDRERLQLAAKPRLVIGNNEDSAYRFRRVRGVVLLPAGGIAIADGASLQLRLFDAQGRFQSASAGKGNGPGQLLNMHWLRRLRGDTIAIGSGLSTVALYSSTGQFARAVAIPPRVAPMNGSSSLLVALLNTELGVSAPLPQPTARSVGVRWTDSLQLKLVSPAGGVVRELGVFPYLVLEQQKSNPIPVWLSSVGVFTASDERFYAGFGDRYEVRVYAKDGKLQSIIRRSWTPTAITDADWEHWVVEWSKLWIQTTGSARERDVQEMREAPWAEHNPAFSQFIVDRSGRLWVREAHWQDAIAAGSLDDTPAVPSVWSVFDARGRWLGDVGMPTGFKPFEIGSDYVIGTQYTGGVNQVVVYGFSSRGG